MPLTTTFSASMAGPAAIEAHWELDGATLGGATVTREYGEPGLHLARLIATDARGLSCEAHAEAEVTAASVRPPRISLPSIDPARCGVGFELQPAAEGTRPLAWTLEGAPPGMTIDAATGALRWRPDSSAQGAHVPLLVATNAAGRAQEPVALEVPCERQRLRVGCGCQGVEGLSALAALLAFSAGASRGAAGLSSRRASAAGRAISARSPRRRRTG